MSAQVGTDNGVEYVELIAATALRDGPTLPAGTIGYVVGFVETPAGTALARVRWLGFDGVAVHDATALRPSTEAAWEAARVALQTATPSLEDALRRVRATLAGGYSALDLDLRDVRAVVDVVATLTAERDAARAQVAGLRARLDGVRAAVVREREARDAIPDDFDADYAAPNERARVYALRDELADATAALDALLSDGGGA